MSMLGGRERSDCVDQKATPAPSMLATSFLRACLYGSMLGRRNANKVGKKSGRPGGVVLGGPVASQSRNQSKYVRSTKYLRRNIQVYTIHNAVNTIELLPVN